MNYAAYLYAGIDIGVRRNSAIGGNVYLNLGCLPQDIKNSSNVYEKGLVDKEFLDFKVVEKSNRVWIIKIANNTGHSVKLEYNEKMCFVDDAKNWVNLNNLNSDINIANRNYVTISITENWFATTIAFSQIYNEDRYICYANMLDAGNVTYITYNDYFIAK